MSSSSKQSAASQRSFFGLLQFLFYRTVRSASGIVAVFVFQMRCVGREYTHVPGGALILSTHQSHFDPMLVGVTFNERLNYLAKRSLFKSRLFGGLISLLNAIELDRDRSGLAGLKETIKRLKRGEKVLIFPEGTRSADGLIAPLKPGFLSVARRSQVPLIPVAITGAFDALPRGSRIPLRYPLRVAVGPAITAEQVASLDDEGVLALITERLQQCHQRAQASRIS
jgi:1-acyl-sn-glycerol-3-phosphate acyltransferase